MSRNYALINYIFIKISLKYLVISYLYGFATTLFPLLLFFGVFFIPSTLILQMANTRNSNANAENNNGENNDATNPPPPPLPTLEQVRAMQAQILQTMQQTTAAER
jgi:hypothetical protein